MRKKSFGNTITSGLTAACVLILAACSIPTAPPGSPTQTSPVPATATRAAPVEATATATQPPTPPPPTEIPPLPVISAQNAASLSAAVVDLSTGLAADAFIRWLVWPAANEVDVVTNSNVLLVSLDTQSYDAPAPLVVNGTLLDIAPDGSMLAAGSPGGAVTLYDMAGNPRHELDEPAAYGAAFSPDGAFVAVPSAGEWAVSVYNAANGARLARLTGFETAAPVYGALVAPGGKTVAWVARATLQFQDVGSGAIMDALGFEEFIGSLAFSPDGSRLAFDAGSQVYLYSTTDSRELAALEVSEPVRALAYSPDGSLLAAAYGDGVQIWDGNTLAPLATLPAGQGPFMQLSFSPDGRALAAAGEGKDLVIWQVRGE